MKIGIIGGTRGLGKTIAWYLKDFNFDVTITGRDTIIGNQVSEELGIKSSGPLMMEPIILSFPVNI